MPLVCFAAIGYALVSYQIFLPLAGFSRQVWNEYNFAKMVRQMRNVQIKQ